MKFFYIYLSSIIGLYSLAAADNIVNLNRIGEIFGFPSSQLVVEDYSEKERSAYRDKTLIEIQNNISPPFEPDRIFKAYKISAKNKETFLPIIFTVVARDTYRTEEIENLEIQMKSLREVPAAEGGRLPFGNFKVSKQTDGFFLIIPEMRVPAKPIRLEHMPLDALTFVDKYPDHQPCNVSFMKVPDSNVDVRIAQYMDIENFENQIKGLIPILGGEKYFAQFSNLTGDETSEEPRHEMILRVFKALNLEVLESPMLNSFRKEKKIEKPNIAPEPRTIPQPLDAPKPEASPQERLPKVTIPEPEDYSWRWLVGLIALLLAIGLAMKRYFAKRAA